jgi:phage tail sheath protein FI
VTSIQEYECTFGDIQTDIPLSVAVHQYFANGGQVAVIVRVERSEVANPRMRAAQEGLWAFDKTEPINLLCIPPSAPGVDVTKKTWKGALKYCRVRGIFLIIDPPSNWKTIKDVTVGIEDWGIRDGNAALYFPYLMLSNLNRKLANYLIVPSGAVAGIIVRTDLNHGVWKAPAGTSADFDGSPVLSVVLNEEEIGELNQLGINSLRELPNIGTVIWGARTLAGHAIFDSEWEYISVRRTALFIERSLDRGLQWVVFEPNDEPLWTQIRTQVEVFLSALFRNGAFAGRTQDVAYFVKCDTTTTTIADINDGNLNLLVGFAPLKPAEFIIIKLQFQMNQ